MSDLEGAIAIARTLLDEASQIYKGARGNNDLAVEGIKRLVAQILEPHGLGFTFHPDGLWFDIVKLMASALTQLSGQPDHD